ncbi:Uncharacterised protein [Mycobacteroides abscessus subsp. abscessus]|nr:Uncharacterised protein [Mycobacteroides abscessus subsp. abscessus]
MALSSSLRASSPSASRAPVQVLCNLNTTRRRWLHVGLTARLKPTKRSSLI